MPQEVNYKLKAMLLEVVENQMSIPETSFVKDKYNELCPKYGKQRALEMIAAILVGELYDMQTQGKTYDNERYKRLIGELK